MNKIIIIGNLTRDIELKTTQHGTPVATFDVAVGRRYKNPDGTSETDFLKVVAWRGLAETCSKYLKKGSKAAVTGSLQTRTYEDKNRQKRTVYEILAEDVEFLTPKEKTKEEKTSYEELEDFKPIDDENLPF